LKLVVPLSPDKEVWLHFFGPIPTREEFEKLKQHIDLVVASIHVPTPAAEPETVYIQPEEPAIGRAELPTLMDKKRPHPVMKPEERQEILDLYAAGVKMSDIQKRTGWTYSTVHVNLVKAGVYKPQFKRSKVTANGA